MFFEKEFKDLKELTILYEQDSNELNKIKQQLILLYSQIKQAEITCLFSKEADINNAFLEVNAGAGGTESCDWAQMLLRMYMRFCENHNFKTEIVDMLEGEEAGIKSATIKVSGKYAYGWLKSEKGVHRLVRISPFDSNKKRHTSFASIWAYPEIDDSIVIEIDEKDLLIDTYRAGGKGGQHVNKTESAIRITHKPSGVVVQCQNGRSQHRNKDEALKLLKSRLYELELSKKETAKENQNSLKTDNSWGNQIRSYVLHPYQMVKDLRTSHETSDTQGVLDGDLDKFVMEFLKVYKD